MPKHIMELVTGLSLPAKKLGIFQAHKDKSPVLIGRTPTPPSRPRDDRPQCFTPPSFDLGFSQTTPENELIDDCTFDLLEAEFIDDYTSMEAEPIPWAIPKGNQLNFSW